MNSYRNENHCRISDLPETVVTAQAIIDSDESGYVDHAQLGGSVMRGLVREAFFKQSPGRDSTTATLAAAARGEAELAEGMGTFLHSRANGGIGDTVAKANVHALTSLAKGGN